MKKMITLLLLAVTFTVSAQTYMPDDAFEAWCETLGYGDGILNNDTIDDFAASVVPQLNLDNVGISDLTGIEAFTSCHTINVANNTLSNIDISFFGNTLIYFNATNNNNDLYCITVSDTSYAVLQTILGPYSIDLVHGKNSLLVPTTKNHKWWYKHIKTLINNPNMVKDLGEQLYEDVQKYHIKEVTKDRAEWYKSIVNK